MTHPPRLIAERDQLAERFRQEALGLAATTPAAVALVGRVQAAENMEAFLLEHGKSPERVAAICAAALIELGERS